MTPEQQNSHADSQHDSFRVIGYGYGEECEMSKLHKMGKGNHGGTVYVFHCPGCGYSHPVEVPRWNWNGSIDAPTFSPSLLCNKDNPEIRCHSFIEEGRIRFLSDCWHELAGQTADIPEWQELS